MSDDNDTRPVLMTDTQRCVALTQRLAMMPLSHETMQSTWCPPEYEDIEYWWDYYVTKARTLTGLTHEHDLEGKP